MMWDMGCEIGDILNPKLEIRIGNAATYFNPRLSVGREGFFGRKK